MAWTPAQVDEIDVVKIEDKGEGFRRVRIQVSDDSRPDRQKKKKELEQASGCRAASACGLSGITRSAAGTTTRAAAVLRTRTRAGRESPGDGVSSRSTRASPLSPSGAFHAISSSATARHPSGGPGDPDGRRPGGRAVTGTPTSRSPRGMMISERLR